MYVKRNTLLGLLINRYYIYNMKKSKDNYEVPDYIWYYLLDYGDRDNHSTLNEIYGVKRLGELTMKRLLNYFHVATQMDIQDLNKKL